MARQSIEDIRKAELIEAALAVVAEEGHDAATTQKIAARAGISAGIVHHYFGDKATLLQATMRAIRKPVALAYAENLAARGLTEPVGRAALEACLEAHLSPSILTVRRAAAWLQFAARVAYVPDYARVHSLVRYRQVAALTRAVRPLVPQQSEAAQQGMRLAVALDGYWMECATREGGLRSGEARMAIDALLSDSIW
ncbi:MAG: TetR family transcriptional regulator [Alphaproteobacteria bacterium]|nr:TetR family transcriptional regulator [Alphaproteobacteria bacterium]